MPRNVAPVALLVFALTACGHPCETDAESAQASPEATFAAMRQASMDSDWEALYALFAPSEREASEERWERLRTEASQEAPPAELTELAEGSGVAVDALPTLSLRELFVRRNALQAERGGPELVERVRKAEFLGIELVEGQPDALLVRFRLDAAEMQLPMKKEDGRWWLDRTLTALTDV